MTSLALKVPAVTIIGTLLGPRPLPCRPLPSTVNRSIGGSGVQTPITRLRLSRVADGPHNDLHSRQGAYLRRGPFSRITPWPSTSPVSRTKSTFAPNSAIRRAVAAPIPLVPPVMSATLPENFRSGVFKLRCTNLSWAYQLLILYPQSADSLMKYSGPRSATLQVF